LSLALDRRELLDSVLQRAGEPAASLQPEGIAGRRPDVWPADNAATARQLLASAGYSGGSGFPPITLTYSTSAEWRLFAEYAQQRWSDVLGITVRLESMERAAFLTWRRGSEWERSGDLYRGSWFSDFEDPHNWYNVVWASDADPSTFNGGWRNDQFDQLVRQATGELDNARRVSLYNQAEAVLAQDYPHIPLFHEEVRSLVKPYLQGYTPSRVLGLAPLRTMRLSGGR
jgi:ABC-type transport system substrate-binding protein